MEAAAGAVRVSGVLMAPGYPRLNKSQNPCDPPHAGPRTEVRKYPSTPPQGDRMSTRTRRALPLLAAALATSLAAFFAVTVGFGSSHREAPAISLDPSADNTDVYAYTAKDVPGALTVVANWIPMEDPAGGPNFYRFDDAAKYYVKVDNTGDGRADVEYRFRFRTTTRNRNSFLYAAPGVTSLSDPKLNVIQHYSVTRISLRNGRETNRRVLARNVPVAPNNVGPKTFPDYDRVAAGAIRSLPGGGKVFAGQVDDPFFV